MKKELRILMIDDDDDDFIIVRNIISDINSGIKTKKIYLDCTSTYSEGIKIINEKRHDVYLIDFYLGARLGSDIIREAIENGCEAPLILLTGQDNAEADREALKAGAADYLTKRTLSAEILYRSIRYSIAHSKDMRAIKYINEDLEERVKDRTMVLQEALNELNKTKEELDTALKKEKELNELKSRFVSMASHEFRTPLAAITSSLSLISIYREKEEKEKQIKHETRIKSSVDHLTHLINDVLSLSSLEEGKTSTVIEDFIVDEFISEIVLELQEVAKTNQKITYNHSGSDNVKFDKKILKYILFNFISNAIKFSSEGQTIEVISEVKNDGLKFSVSDNGIGIPDEDQKYMFDRFFRARNATDIQGTGLGLNIIAKYVEIFKGEINFKSKLGEGSTFMVTLPKIVN